MRALIALLVLAFPLCAAPVPKSLQPKAVDERLFGHWEKLTEDSDEWEVRLQLSPEGVCSCSMRLKKRAALGSHSAGTFLVAASSANKFPVIKLNLALCAGVSGEWSLLELDDEKLRLGHQADGSEVEYRRVKEEKVAGK